MMINQTSTQVEGEITLKLTLAESAMLIEILSSRHAELLENQRQGEDGQWLGDAIDELEAFNYKFKFLVEFEDCEAQS